MLRGSCRVERFHGRQNFAGADARQGGAVDGGGGKHVVAEDLDRSRRIADLGHRAQRHHVVVGVADLELADGLGVGAEGGLGLDVDLPRAAETVEIVHVVAGQVRLQRVEHFGKLHAHRLDLGAVDVDIELRRAGAEAGEQADQPRLAVALGGQFVGPGLEGVEVDVARHFQHQLEPAGRAQAVHRRGAEHVDAGLGHLAANRWRSAAAIASALSAGSRRSWNGFKGKNAEPTFELTALRMNDRPRFVIECATPGVSRPIRSIFSMTSSVRSSEAESGNCTLTTSRPLSCVGMKPAERG